MAACHSAVADNPIMRPARQRYEDLVAQAKKLVQRWIETGRFEEAHGRHGPFHHQRIIDRVIGHLEYNETTQGLIRAQADAYLAFLENPEPVRELINNEVGAFLGELEGDPEQPTVSCRKLPTAISIIFAPTRR